MRAIFSAVIVLIMLFGALIFAFIAAALSSSSSIAAGVFGLMAVICLVLAFRRLARGGRRRVHIADELPDEGSLRHWHNAECQRVQRPRDPRTKFCLANVGKEIPILYRGHKLHITPIRVYTKPKYKKTYVDAMRDGEKRTYDIDDMSV